MAEESGQEKSVSHLKQEIAHSRDWLARDLGGLRYELDFPLKFRRSFQRQMLVWVAAALVIGLAFSVMPARTKVIRVNSKAKEFSALAWRVARCDSRLHCSNLSSSV